MKRIFLPAFLSITLFIFLYWTAAVLTPVAMIEANYQYRRLLRDVFHTSSLRGLILPQFYFDLKGFTAKNKTNGLNIPDIFIDTPVIYNVDPNDEKAYSAALKIGIAHASSTGFPGSGGLGYYFAHSSTPELAGRYNAVFYLLGKLRPGAEIHIWHEGIRYDYQVHHTEITAPADTEFLRRLYPDETVVLQTCWPPGTTSRRLLVFATRNTAN